jgi:large subunit ribosomal protein L13
MQQVGALAGRARRRPCAASPEAGERWARAASPHLAYHEQGRAAERGIFAPSPSARGDPRAQDQHADFHDQDHTCFDARNMSTVASKTYVAKPTDREREWVLLDANGKTLGRLATQIADLLRGKRKPAYTPHIDTGDFVVVINAEKVAVTGSKRTDKRYYRHSGYPGGLRSRSFEEMISRRPEEVIRLAVKGMMPRNRLARKQITKLKIYAGPEHPHEAQKPRTLETEQ